MGPGLCLHEFILLVPGLLHLPALPDDIPILALYSLDCLILLILNIRDPLGPDNSGVCYLNLMPEQIQRISLIDGIKNLPGLVREIL